MNKLKWNKLPNGYHTDGINKYYSARRLFEGGWEFDIDGHYIGHYKNLNHIKMICELLEEQRNRE